MARCEHCPVAAGLACRAESDARYGFFCRQAEAGPSPSQLAAIKALSGEPPAYPSLARQAVGFAGAVATHVASGMAKVDDETLARRLAICEGCPIYDAPAERCRKCGCRMPRKARWAAMECPLGNWEAETG